MINYLNQTLRELFLAEIAELIDEAQVRFQPPDADWRTYVSNLTVDGQLVNALNVYLVDLRENRRLRSNGRTSQTITGQIEHTRAHDRLECHYLISAWSPAQLAPHIEPAFDEHALLYQVTRVLMNTHCLNPSQIYLPADPDLLAIPELIRDRNLPFQVVPVEGFPKLAEFWGAMGSNHRWKPVVYLNVTLPVAQNSHIAGPEVTSTGVSGNDSTQTRYQIGGYVLDATGIAAVPIAKAWVRLERLSGQPVRTTETDHNGRFNFSSLSGGEYQLNWRARGYPIPAPRVITVPIPSGGYDLRFE